MTLTATPLGDLDAKRLDRARARAARKEARGETLPIVLGGQVIATLGAEFPLDVLEPLADINLDIALLLQQAVAAAQATDNAANVDLIVNILAANPDLPREFLAAVKEIGRRLLGDGGYAAFVAARPSPWDVAALASTLFSWYGVSLGESSGSSDAVSEGNGVTSNTISGPTGVSTPATSGVGLTIPDSLAFDG